MPIPVVSFLETSPPTNPNFGVVADEYLIGGWRSVADIAARDAIYSGRRIAGMHAYVRDVDQVYRLDADLTTWHLVAPGSTSEAAIYLDTAGDDSASGDASNPIATIAEAIARTRQRGTTRWHLGAGTFAPEDYSAAGDERRSIISGDKVYLKGTTSVIDSFTFASVANNVVTAQGSPGWTINEHVGRRLRWFVFGPSWDDYDYSWVIISNTANTLTCALTWQAPGLGGAIPPPGVGTDLDIVEHTTKIARNAASDSFTNKLHTEGDVTFHNIYFDGTLNGGGRWGVTRHTEGSRITLSWCTFEGHTSIAVDAQEANVAGCHFVDCADALLLRGGSVNTDNYFENCTEAIKVAAVGGVALAHGDYVWAKDCTNVFSVGPGALVDDGSIGVWLDNCDYYSYLADGGHHRKTAFSLIGFDAAARDLNTNVFWMDGSFNKVDIYNAAATTVGPDVGFFNFRGSAQSLTDFAAGGNSTEDESGNRATT